MLLLGTTWLTASFGNSSSPTVNNSKQDFFHTFNDDLPAALATAKAKNKFGLVLFFGTQHCRFCHRMKATVLSKPHVQAFYRQHFQLIDIDIESAKQLRTTRAQQQSYIEFAKTHRVRLTPTIIYTDEKGETIYKHMGIIADPKEFIWLGEYVINGETAKQSFASYKMKRRRLNPL